MGVCLSKTAVRDDELGGISELRAFPRARLSLDPPSRGSLENKRLALPHISEEEVHNNRYNEASTTYTSELSTALEESDEVLISSHVWARIKNPNDRPSFDVPDAEQRLSGPGGGRSTAPKAPSMIHRPSFDERIREQVMKIVSDGECSTSRPWVLAGCFPTSLVEGV
jgi:hypothetical protein